MKTAANKVIYYGMDYCKFFCAIMIVFMHTIRGNSEFVYWVRDVLTTIGVPYFFIASGFFFAKGVSRGEPLAYTKKYFKRIFILYTAWSILVIPVSLLCIDMRYPESSVFFRILYLVRMFFLSGSCGIYWYILALLINCWILYYLYIKKIPEYVLWVIAIIAFGIGVMYNSGYYKDLLFFESIHVIFGSVNNFLHTGLIYMLIGYYFAFHKISQCLRLLVPLFFLGVIIRTWECHHSDFQFFQLFLAVILFLISAQLKVGNAQTSIWARRLSMALYLEHFPILIVIDHFWWVNNFCFIFLMMVLICAVLYFSMREWLPEPFFKMFYAESKC